MDMMQQPHDVDHHSPQPLDTATARDHGHGYGPRDPYADADPQPIIDGLNSVGIALAHQAGRTTGPDFETWLWNDIQGRFDTGDVTKVLSSTLDFAGRSWTVKIRFETLNHRVVGRQAQKAT